MAWHILRMLLPEGHMEIICRFSYFACQGELADLVGWVAGSESATMMSLSTLTNLQDSRIRTRIGTALTVSVCILYSGSCFLFSISFSLP
jgi:hypothetical protein